MKTTNKLAEHILSFSTRKRKNQKKPRMKLKECAGEIYREVPCAERKKMNRPKERKNEKKE